MRAARDGIRSVPDVTMSGMLGGLGGLVALAAGSLLFGVGSAFVPVMNAETYLTATAATADIGPALVAAVAMAAGQAAGKIAVFLAARQGRNLRLPWQRRTPPVPAAATQPGRLRTLARRGLELLDRPLLGAGVVLTSSSMGVPPLAATSVVAGLSRMRLPVFATTVLGGRILWFLAVTVAASRLLN